MRSQMIGLKKGGKKRIKTGRHGEIHQRGKGREKTEGLNNYGKYGRIKKGGKAEGLTQGGRAEKST